MEIPIPQFLNHLKLDHRGYPIPFFVAYVNGKPDFRMLCERKQHMCVDRKLCSICGKKLHEFYYFITGPMGLQSCTHSDPPMHKYCAEYSIDTCPHLHFQRAQVNDRGDVYKEIDAKNYARVKEKPNTLFLIKADKFKLLNMPGYGHVLQFRKVSAVKYIYENNLLIKANA